MRMQINSAPRRRLVIAILLAACFSLTAQTPAARQVVTAEQEYKNIKALRGTPAEDFNQTMHLMSGQLGVNCEYCHPQRDRVSDEMKAKVVARDMITMTAELNNKSFNGKQVISCYTCHQGRPVPLGVPTLPNAEFDLKEGAAKQFPAPAQIIAKYIAALGGEQKLRGVTSRVVTATQDVPSGPGGVNPVPGTTERYQKAPSLLLNVYRTAMFTSSNGFDGKSAWAQAANGRVADLPSLEQIRTARAAELLEPLQLQQSYSRMTIEGIERVNGRDAFVLVGFPKEDIAERLYFDAETGLLLRKFTVTPTAIGNSPYQVDYSDYRETNSGVKYPFLIHMEPAGPRLELVTHSTIRVQKVEDNVPIDGAKFVRPISKEPPPAPAPAKAAAQ